ncbi:MAG: hypothetical protein AYK19_20725 [Theionarchaea archaeon DG-70-1]|nr:MAG: hypothetical protein AYK19_20725 [Theionarchaea archaeon DG-70-1]
MEFYVDGVLKYTDTTAPFEYYFDPCLLKEDEYMTISVKGYCSGAFINEDSVTVYVDCVLSYVTITYPQDGQTVSGRVVITVDASSDIDAVEFYIDGVLMKTDTRAPFSWGWNTKKSGDGLHTITVKGYAGGVFMDDDTITVIVSNSSIALLSWLILFLPMGIIIRKH